MCNLHEFEKYWYQLFLKQVNLFIHLKAVYIKVTREFEFRLFKIRQLNFLKLFLRPQIKK